MSAYVVHEDTIALLAQAAARWGITDYGRPDDVRGGGYSDICARLGETKIGQILLAENVYSVNVRYREAADIPAYKHRFVCLDAAALRCGVSVSVLVLASVQCLRYQSCEAPDYDQSRACRILQRIEWEAIRHLPGFDDAPHGWTRRDMEPAAVAGCRGRAGAGDGRVSGVRRLGVRV